MEILQRKIFIASSLFINKAIFSLQDVMHVYKLHTWADEKAFTTRTRVYQWHFTLNVWAGIVGYCLLNHYILPERFDDSIFFAHFKKVLPVTVNNILMLIRRNIFYK